MATEYATQKEAETALRPMLTDEFFATIVFAARTVGWSVDLSEVCDFIDRCCDIAERPRLEEIVGFEYTDDDK